MDKIKRIVIAGYAWMAGVFMGAVLFDVIYARLLSRTLGEPARQVLYSEISDILLLIGFVTLVFGLGAVILTWGSLISWSLFSISLLLLGSEFIFPIFFSKLLDTAGISTLGVWLRLLPSVLASGLASLGLAFYPQKPPDPIQTPNPFLKNT